MAETLITSSVLILGIILLRFLLRGRISHQPDCRKSPYAVLKLGTDPSP